MSLTITLTVNGKPVTAEVEPRTLLSQLLRDQLGLTGTHVGCEHGVCGACTVLVDGAAVRSCLMFAVQADGTAIATIEGLTPGPGELSVLQDAFCETHGMQCGYCTPAMAVSLKALLDVCPDPSEAEVRDALGGCLCRCTGYVKPVEAGLLAARLLRDRA